MDQAQADAREADWDDYYYSTASEPGEADEEVTQVCTQVLFSRVERVLTFIE